MPAKQDIRNRVKEHRQQLDAAVLEEKSRSVKEKIVSTPEFKKAACIYVYVDFGGEAATREIIKAAMKAGKRVAVPKVNGDSMEFYYIEDLADLSPGTWGIMEPGTQNPASEEEALMLMPGVAFDEKGNRIGYGKGYYDKYLHSHNRHYKMGLAFEYQIFQQVPHEETDVRADAIITESRIIICKG